MGGHLGVKFQVRRYFTFAMARWKLCVSTRFESLPLSTCTLCQEKCHISKGIQPIFEIFGSARSVWGGGGYLGGKFQVRRYFTFAKARWELYPSTTFECLPLSTCTLCHQKSYISKRYSADFRNLCLSSKMFRVGIVVVNIQVCRYFTFSKAGWELCASTTFESLPLSIFKLWQQKSYISKGIQPMGEMFATARRFLRVCMWVESFRCAGILLLQWQCENLRIDSIWNFSTFNMYTVPGKILYLQGYSNDFRNLCFSWKMLKVDIWVESFRGGGILLLQWQGENFAHRQHLIFWHFQHVQCASKNPLSPKVFNRFSQSLHQLEDVEIVGIWVESVRYAGILLWQWQGENFTHRQHLKFLPLSTCTLCQQKSYISERYSTDFQNLCLFSKMFNVGIWMVCSRCAGILLLQ